MQIPDPNDSWALVELYRWQHGTLPETVDEKPLDEAAGLRAMAEALETKPPTEWPEPFNIASVLKYAAKLIDGTARKQRP